MHAGLCALFSKNKAQARQSVRASQLVHCTEMRFASFLSGGFTTMAVMNPPEKKLEKRTYVLWWA